MATALEKDTDDLSTCCVCLDLNNKEERKPKFLSCGNTLYLKCVEVNINSSSNYTLKPTGVFALRASRKQNTLTLPRARGCLATDV